MPQRARHPLDRTGSSGHFPISSGPIGRNLRQIQLKRQCRKAASAATGTRPDHNGSGLGGTEAGAQRARGSPTKQYSSASLGLSRTALGPGNADCLWKDSDYWLNEETTLLMMKVAVVGAGAMGCAYGGRLAESGHEVWFLDIWEEHVAMLDERGLRIEGVGGDRTVKVRATTRPTDIGPVDLVFIAVKSWATHEAVQSARQMLGPTTIVLTVQNGLGNVQVIAEAVGQQRVVAGIALESGVIKGPGHLLHTSSTETQIADLVGGKTRRVEQLAETFNAAGIKTIVAENVDTVIWGKLLLNVTVNAITAVTGLTCSELPEYESTAALLQLVITEAASVAKAVGVRLPYDDPVARVFQNCREVGRVKPSMLQDLEAGRRTEIDFMNGAIVREGERVGVATPYNAALTLLVKGLEQSGVRKGKPLR